MKSTKFIEQQIERDRQKLKSPTTFVERFLIDKLNQKSNYSVVYQKEGWMVTLGNYETYMLNDFECVPANELATQVKAKFIEKEWINYMSHNLSLLKARVFYQLKSAQLKKQTVIEKTK